ncbi:MAG: hypothetical protein HZA95_00670 [Candidatus Vogelbacteria bacterium]|nr:hypothetical protein [Candidatus Vogelbacteria bacterium]
MKTRLLEFGLFLVTSLQVSMFAIPIVQLVTGKGWWKETWLKRIEYLLTGTTSAFVSYCVIASCWGLGVIDFESASPVVMGFVFLILPTAVAIIAIDVHLHRNSESG